MKIRCVSNRGKDLPLDCRARGFDEDAILPLIIGKEYVVYGLTVHMGYFWYYICDENYDGEIINYPIWSPAPLFEIVDSRMSKFWNCGFYNGGSAEESYAIISYEEWSSNPSYYYNLTENVKEDITTFMHYKALMDNEF